MVLGSILKLSDNLKRSDLWVIQFCRQATITTIRSITGLDPPLESSCVICSPNIGQYPYSIIGSAFMLFSRICFVQAGIVRSVYRISYGIYAVRTKICVSVSGTLNLVFSFASIPAVGPTKPYV